MRGPKDWFEERWETGEFRTSATFRAVEGHEAIFRKSDGLLIAVTGPAGDLESQSLAKLFVVAPKMLVAIKSMIDQVGVEDAEQLRELIKQAEGA